MGSSGAIDPDAVSRVAGAPLAVARETVVVRKIAAIANTSAEKGADATANTARTSVAEAAQWTVAILVQSVWADSAAQGVRVHGVRTKTDTITVRTRGQTTLIKGSL